MLRAFGSMQEQSQRRVVVFFYFHILYKRTGRNVSTELCVEIMIYEHRWRRRQKEEKKSVWQKLKSERDDSPSCDLGRQWKAFTTFAGTGINALNLFHFLTLTTHARLPGRSQTNIGQQRIHLWAWINDFLHIPKKNGMLNMFIFSSHRFNRLQ